MFGLSDLIVVSFVLGLAAFAIYMRARERKAAKKTPKTVTKFVIPREFLRHYPGCREVVAPNGVDMITVIDIGGQTVGFADNGEIGYSYTKLGRQEWELWPDMQAFRHWLAATPVKQVQPPKQQQPQHNTNQQQPQVKGGAVKKVLTEAELDDYNRNAEWFTTYEKDNTYALPQGWHWERVNGSQNEWYGARNGKKP